MPNYTFKDNATGEIVQLFMKISERDEYVKNNPHMTQQITGAPAIGDSVRLGLRHHDSNFNDVLKNIKSHHKHNTIETL